MFWDIPSTMVPNRDPQLSLWGRAGGKNKLKREIPGFEHRHWQNARRKAWDKERMRER